MKSLTSIAFLLFYITVSVGVHVDVDTCCKSIAGFSIFNDEAEHTPRIADDCCAKETVKTCCSSEESSSEGCPSDCVFIQILQEAPQVSALAELNVSPVDLDNLIPLTDKTEDSSPATLLSWHEEPPNLASSEKLFLHFSAFVTYG
jgi:hypothetical protein